MRMGPWLIVPRARTVLIVDEEPRIAEMLTDLLRLDNHRVDVAPDDRVALERLRRHTHDLVLSDLTRSELDGPGLYAVLERDHRYLLGRITFRSGDTRHSDITTLLERAQVPYLHKPITLEDVRRVVQRVLLASGV